MDSLPSFFRRRAHTIFGLSALLTLAAATIGCPHRGPPPVIKPPEIAPIVDAGPPPVDAAPAAIPAGNCISPSASAEWKKDASGAVLEITVMKADNPATPNQKEITGFEASKISHGGTFLSKEATADHIVVRARADARALEIIAPVKVKCDTSFDNIVVAVQRQAQKNGVTSDSIITKIYH